ncbi:MAG: carbonic anhydrase [Bacteroidota bacterium]|nr:carbonic anhydrase [Bacteroidota bacterium]
MNRLIEITKTNNIFQEHRDTPIGRLFEYHNLNRPFDVFSNAQLLIGMCMDNRLHLRSPDNFAYIIRAGGANLQYSEFNISYAIALGSIQHIAIIGHNNCGMTNLVSRKEQFISGLIKHAGWDKESAEDHFTKSAPLFEIVNDIDFVLSEAKQLRLRYPKVTIAPIHYNIEDKQLYLIEE